MDDRKEVVGRSADSSQRGKEGVNFEMWTWYGVTDGEPADVIEGYYREMPSSGLLPLILFDIKPAISFL